MCRKPSRELRTSPSTYTVTYASSPKYVPKDCSDDSSSGQSSNKLDLQSQSFQQQIILPRLFWQCIKRLAPPSSTDFLQALALCNTDWAQERQALTLRLGKRLEGRDMHERFLVGRFLQVSKHNNECCPLCLKPLLLINPYLPATLSNRKSRRRGGGFQEGGFSNSWLAAFLVFFTRKSVIARVFLLEFDTSLAIVTLAWRTAQLFWEPRFRTPPPLEFPNQNLISFTNHQRSIHSEHRIWRSPLEGSLSDLHACLFPSKEIWMVVYPSQEKSTRLNFWSHPYTCWIPSIGKRAQPYLTWRF